MMTGVLLAILLVADDTALFQYSASGLQHSLTFSTVFLTRAGCDLSLSREAKAGCKMVGVHIGYSRLQVCHLQGKAHVQSLGLLPGFELCTRGGCMILWLTSMLQCMLPLLHCISLYFAW